MTEKTSVIRRQTGHVARPTVRMSPTDRNKLRIMSHPGRPGTSGDITVTIDADLLRVLATGMECYCYRLWLSQRSRYDTATIDEKYMVICLEEGVKVLADALYMHKGKS